MSTTTEQIAEIVKDIKDKTTSFIQELQNFDEASQDVGSLKSVSSVFGNAILELVSKLEKHTLPRDVKTKSISKAGGAVKTPNLTDFMQILDTITPSPTPNDQSSSPPNHHHQQTQQHQQHQMKNQKHHHK